MSIYAGIQIHSSDDIIINTALGKNVIFNGKEYNGNGIGIRFLQVQEKLRYPVYMYSTEDVEIRTDIGKKVSINGTDYLSTTGISRVASPITSFFQNGAKWYFTGDFIIEVAPSKKILINDTEIKPGPSIPTEGLNGWYDASQLDLLDGALVTSWPDISGLGRDLITQPAIITGTPPTMKFNGLNGFKVVRYNGNDNVLTVHYNLRGIYSHFFVVAKYNSSSFPDYDGLITGINGSEYVLIGTGGGTTFYPPGPAGWKYYKNGILDSARVGPMQQWELMGISVPTPYVDFQLSVGLDRVFPPRYWDGDVAEVITYDRVLLDVEREQVEDYLRKKWGIAPPLVKATLTSISHNNMVAQSGQLLIVNGLDFVPDSVIYDISTPVQTTYVSPTRLTSTYFGTIATPHQSFVGVQNPGTVYSNTFVLDITAP